MRFPAIPRNFIARLFTRRQIQGHRRQMSGVVPQVRPLSELGSEEPVSKKLRLNDEPLTLRAKCMPEDDLVIGQDGEVVLEESKVVAKGRKKQKKNEPPLPEASSPADVLYREIRNLLGEDVVDDVTKAGNAFKAPFSHGDELVVKIELLASGGKSLVFVIYEHSSSYSSRLWYSSCTSRKGPMGYCRSVRASGRDGPRSDWQVGAYALCC